MKEILQVCVWFAVSDCHNEAAVGLKNLNNGFPFANSTASCPRTAGCSPLSNASQLLETNIAKQYECYSSQQIAVARGARVSR